MRTRVVNLKNSAYDVYIGRAGKGQDGYFGNPCAIGRPCPECGQTHHSGGSTIACFRKYFERRLFSDPEFKRRVQTLKGKTLGCFCHPSPCHGHVMVSYLEKGE